MFYGEQDYEKAIEYADLGLETLSAERECPQITGRLTYHKANCFYHLDRKAQAYKHVIETQQVCEQTQDFKTLLLGYNLEGIIVAHQQLYAQAVDVFQKAIHLSSQHFPDPRIGSLLYLNLGDTYYRDKAYEQSLAYYDLAYELSQKAKDKNILATIYFSYGEVYFATNQLGLATEYVEKAAALKEQMELTSEYLPLLLLRAKIALGENSDEVKAICEEGIRLAEQSMLYSKKKEFHLVLANYYEQVGNEDALQRETKNMYQVESIINGR
ncbi:tetratricopeptide repeat protein [Numidum massiliense]|uniref:tetratricopeptide repeat protein n=1 Tax=Numidum massiliense TaxID=1522315 RepID=UPI0006D54930|nr:tetratricopeptide repeat protein [Numidum massiliense]